MSDFSIYPQAIDGYAQLPLVVDTVTPVNAISVNRLRSAIYNIEVELGVLPSGSYSTVRERLDALENSLDEIEGQLGGVVFATQEEVDAGLSDDSIVTPLTLANTSLSFNPKEHADTHLSTGSDPISEMSGATAIEDGLDGLVTKPLAGDEDKFLKGDGGWSAVKSLDTTIVEVTSTTYTILSGDDIVLVNQTSDAAVAIQLPPGGNHEVGQVIIKDKKGTASTRTITISADGAETIDGQSTHEITFDYRSRKLIFSGTEWSIV